VYRLRFSLKTQKFLIALALTALVWIVFAQTAHFDWVRYDDRDYVYGSARVTSGLSFSNLAWAFTHFHAANWHPITTLSHMLDCQLFGVNPGSHHFSSVVIHTLAVIALFFALDSLTGKIWRSGVVAGVFAIHPLRAGIGGMDRRAQRTFSAAYSSRSPCWRGPVTLEGNLSRAIWSRCLPPRSGCFPNRCWSRSRSCSY
jgi:hypothetical protein